MPGEDEIDPLANEDGDRDFRARVQELELLVLLGGYVDGGRDLLARHRLGGALLSLARAAIHYVHICLDQAGRDGETSSLDSMTCEIGLRANLPSLPPALRSLLGNGVSDADRGAGSNFSEQI